MNPRDEALLSVVIEKKTEILSLFKTVLEYTVYSYVSTTATADRDRLYFAVSQINCNDTEETINDIFIDLVERVKYWNPGSDKKKQLLGELFQVFVLLNNIHIKMAEVNSEVLGQLIAKLNKEYFPQFKTIDRLDFEKQLLVVSELLKEIALVKDDLFKKSSLATPATIKTLASQITETKEDASVAEMRKTKETLKKWRIQYRSLQARYQLEPKASLEILRQKISTSPLDAEDAKILEVIINKVLKYKTKLDTLKAAAAAKATTMASHSPRESKEGASSGESDTEKETVQATKQMGSMTAGVTAVVDSPASARSVTPDVATAKIVTLNEPQTPAEPMEVKQSDSVTTDKPVLAVEKTDADKATPKTEEKVAQPTSPVAALTSAIATLKPLTATEEASQAALVSQKQDVKRDATILVQSPLSPPDLAPLATDSPIHLAPSLEIKLNASITPRSCQTKINHAEARLFEYLKTTLKKASVEDQATSYAQKMAATKIELTTFDSFINNYHEFDLVTKVANLNAPKSTETTALAMEMTLALDALENLREIIQELNERKSYPIHDWMPSELMPNKLEYAISLKNWAKTAFTILEPKLDEAAKEKEEEAKARAEALKRAPSLPALATSHDGSLPPLSPNQSGNRDDKASQENPPGFFQRHPYVANGLKLVGAILLGAAICTAIVGIIYFAWPAAIVGSAATSLVGGATIGGIAGVLSFAAKKIWNWCVGDSATPATSPRNAVTAASVAEINTQENQKSPKPSFSPQARSQQARDTLSPQSDQSTPKASGETKRQEPVVSKKPTAVEMCDAIKALIYPDDPAERVRMLNFWSSVGSGKKDEVKENKKVFSIPHKIAVMIEQFKDGMPAGAEQTLELINGSFLINIQKSSLVQGFFSGVDFEKSLYNLVRNPEKIPAATQLKALQSLLQNIKTSAAYVKANPMPAKPRPTHSPAAESA